MIAIASDHAGYDMKISIIKYLKDKGYSLEKIMVNRLFISEKERMVNMLIDRQKLSLLDKIYEIPTR